MRAKQKPFDASKLIEEFGKDELGEVKLTEVHLSSREDFEAPDG